MGGYRVYRYFVCFAYRENAESTTQFSNMSYDSLQELNSLEAIRALEAEVALDKKFFKVTVTSFQLLGYDYI